MYLLLFWGLNKHSFWVQLQNHFMNQKYTVGNSQGKSPHAWWLILLWATEYGEGGQTSALQPPAVLSRGHGGDGGNISGCQSA